MGEESAMEHLAFVDVCKGYGAGSAREVVLDDFSLTLRAGMGIALMGANGSGKSTVLRLAAGLVTPDCGRVRVLGADPCRDGAVRGRTAALFDTARWLHPRLTPEENAAWFASVMGTCPAPALQRFRALSERFGIAALRKTAVRKLSKGTQQKFAFACVTAPGADLWLLDEPTLGLDAAAAATLAELAAAHLRDGGTVLAATHDATFAGAIGHVLRLDASAGYDETRGATGAGCTIVEALPARR
jgi:heme exporter protein A